MTQKETLQDAIDMVNEQKNPTLDQVVVRDLATSLLAATAIIEKTKKKLDDVKEALYGQNFKVYGWHLNGAHEPMDNWFENNDWEATEAEAFLKEINR